MAIYSSATDYTDPAFTVDDTHRANGDTFVDGQLRQRGIDPADIALPQGLLTSIAVAWANAVAANAGAIGDSTLTAKSRAYERQATMLAGTITREGLGLTYPTGAAYGQVTLGRA